MCRRTRSGLACASRATVVARSCGILVGCSHAGALSLQRQTVRQDSVAAVTYLHLELDEHDILLAEGLPAESFSIPAIVRRLLTEVWQ